MILKGNARGGGRQMAAHLLNGTQNEHVTIHQVRGFLATTLRGALEEAWALSRGTQCQKYLYSLSLNPPKDVSVPVEAFEKALKEIEEKLSLTDQPRVIVFHEKEGRRHAHCVWSRINVTEMKAVNIAFDHRKLQALSRALYLEHGWTLPRGLIDPAHRNPLTYTRGEWQQAARTGRSAAAIKACLQECWAASDSAQAFNSVLNERGFMLARGDRRGFVAVDLHGEVFALARQIGVKTKTLEQRLGSPEALPSVTQAQEKIGSQLRALFAAYRAELQTAQERELRPLLRIKKTMTDQHRKDRAAQKAFLEKRWNEEQAVRASRVRTGFKGLWDKLTFKYWKIREANEKEAWRCHIRDREERQDLIEAQLDQRQKLQAQFLAIRTRHEEELQKLMEDMMKRATPQAERETTPDVFKGKGKQADPGIEPRTEPSIKTPRMRRGKDAKKDKGHEPDVL